LTKNEKCGKILNCAEIKITLSVITQTIAPVNLHIELDVTLGHAHFYGKLGYLCARSAFPIQSRVPNLKSLAQVVLELDATMVDMTLNDL